MTNDFDRVCTTITSLVTEYLEEALPREQQLLFETHVVYCSGCSAFLSQIRTIAAALRSLPPVDVDVEERAFLVGAFRSRA